MTTLKNALETARHKIEIVSDSPLLDAEILLCTVIAKDRSYLRGWPESQLNNEQIQQFDALTQQRILGTPIAYLTGSREFWSREFKVTPDVLIPRPDTELLIEICLSLIAPETTLNVVDLGTGSGAIAITLALERPNISMTAVDCSAAALSIAKQNAAQHGITTIKWFESDWMNKLQSESYDLIISNPPYIVIDDPHLLQGDVRFEPQQALIAEDNGLQAIKTISKQALHHLKPNATLLFEHGYQQAAKVRSILANTGYQYTQTFKDLSGNDRVTSGRFIGPISS